ncbi:Immunoglobulin lambda-1 light chain [Merluccius polli]|nr:Immunoglobulin lambda-1 light chain [Merluccius polli]
MLVQSHREDYRPTTIFIPAAIKMLNTGPQCGEQDVVLCDACGLELLVVRKQMQFPTNHNSTHKVFRPPQDGDAHPCALVPTAVVAMAAELTQDQVSWSRREGTAVSFRCTNTDQCNTYIFWYQKKETETFTLILLIVKSNGELDKGYNHPQQDDFSSVLKENSYELSLQKVKVSHSATYYCSCLDSQPTEVYVAGYFTVDVLIFGGGTTLVVTDKTVEKPKVSVYPATGADLKGRRSLLCVARDMVPEVVRVSWRRKGGGGTENEGEQLELRGLPYAASILVIDQQETLRDQYICRVEHESGLQEVEIPEVTVATEGPGTTAVNVTTEGPGTTEVTAATAGTTESWLPGRPRAGLPDEAHHKITCSHFELLWKSQVASGLAVWYFIKEKLIYSLLCKPV